MSGERSSTHVDREAVLAAVRDEQPGTPLTASEIAQGLSCSRRTAYDKLRALAARGDLSTKKIGARGRVWWRPAVGEATGPVDGESAGTPPVPDRSATGSLATAIRPLRDTVSREEIGDVVVRTLTDVIGFEHAAVYRLDTTENALVPMASAVGSADGADLPPVSAGAESSVWACFVDGETCIVDGTAETPFAEHSSGDRAELVVPLADHGVIVAAMADRAGIEEVRASVDLLATVAETTFDDVERRRTVWEYEGRLAEREQRLDRVTRVVDVHRAVERALVTGTTHEEVRAAVCGALTDVDGVPFAWIGTTGEDGTLEPRARSGDDRDYLSAVSLADGDGPEGPAVEAARTGAVAVASNVAEGVRRAPWRREAIAAGFHSAVGVPLTHGDVRYGVLALYANEAGQFGAFEESTFAEIGATVGNAIHAVATRERLLSDTVAELEFVLDADGACFLSTLANATGGEIAFNGVVPVTETSTRLFFTVRDASVATVEDAIADTTGVESVHRVASRADEHVVEAVVTGSTIPAMIVEHEGSVRSLTVDDDGVRVVVDLPSTVDVRGFVERFQDEYASAAFVARRERDRPVQTRQGFRAALDERLTERQREVLATAYYGGLFASPRESTAGDVAERLGVTQPTVTEHLQAAQEKLLDLVFADDALAE